MESTSSCAAVVLVVAVAVAVLVVIQAETVEVELEEVEAGEVAVAAAEECRSSGYFLPATSKASMCMRSWHPQLISTAAKSKHLLCPDGFPFGGSCLGCWMPSCFILGVAASTFAQLIPMEEAVGILCMTACRAVHPWAAAVLADALSHLVSPN